MTLHRCARSHRALDLGVNFIDTAQGYGKGHSEELIGTLLRERERGNLRRHQGPRKTGFPLAAAVRRPGARFLPRGVLIQACEGSLRRLKRDWIDVYQFHTWAASFNVEDEWFEAMSRLVNRGKIRAVGVSVPDTQPESVIGALAAGRVQTVQVIYNIFEQYPRWNLFPVCRKLGTGVIVRVPFDEGALTGKYSASTTFAEGDVRRHYFRGRNLPAVLRRVAAVEEFKERCRPGMPLSWYALRFCLSHPAVGTVIPGIRSERQADLNCAAADGIPLQDTELAELEQFAWRKDFWHEEVTD